MPLLLFARNSPTDVIFEFSLLPTLLPKLAHSSLSLVASKGVSSSSPPLPFSTNEKPFSQTPLMCVWVSHLGARQLFEQLPVANLVAGLTRAVAEFLGFLSVNLLFLGFPWISQNEFQAACSDCDVVWMKCLLQRPLLIRQIWNSSF